MTFCRDFIVTLSWLCRDFYSLLPLLPPPASAICQQLLMHMPLSLQMP